MDIRTIKEVGVTSISVRITLADAIALGQVIAHLDRYDEIVKEPTEVDEETGLIVEDPIERCHKEGFEPIDELMKLRKFCKKLCFVNLADSNIFDDEEPKKDE